MGPKVVAVQAPVAGSDWSWQGPTDRPFRIQSVRAVLASSATVANRAAELHVLDRDRNVIIDVPAIASQAASSTETWSWLPVGFGPGTVDNPALGPLPDCWVPDGCSVKVVTAGIQAGDQWSEIVLLVHVPE